MGSAVLMTIIISIAAISIPITAIIQDYKLKKEKIKADALVRAEEIKAKNQLEIEKLFLSNHARPSARETGYHGEDLRSSRPDRERL